MKVYIVFGTSGEYSDRTTWPIASYTDRNLAEEHVIKATEIADEIAFLHYNLYRSSLQENRGLTEEEIQESNRISKLNLYDLEPQEWLEKHNYYYETTNLLDKLYKEEK